METVAQYRASVFMLGQWINGRYEPGFYVSGWHSQVSALVSTPNVRRNLRAAPRGTRLA